MAKRTSKTTAKSPNSILIETWQEIYDYPVVAEYAPWKEIYEGLFGSSSGIQKWLKSKNLSNYRLDIAFPEDRIYIEVQGQGFGHSGKNATRDMHKHNQLVLAGWKGLYYLATEVKSHPEIICEEISQLLNKRIREKHAKSP